MWVVGEDLKAVGWGYKPAGSHLHPIGPTDTDPRGTAGWLEVQVRKQGCRCRWDQVGHFPAVFGSSSWWGLMEIKICKNVVLKSGISRKVQLTQKHGVCGWDLSLTSESPDPPLNMKHFQQTWAKHKVVVPLEPHKNTYSICFKWEASCQLTPNRSGFYAPHAELLNMHV